MVKLLMSENYMQKRKKKRGKRAFLRLHLTIKPKSLPRLARLT